MDKHMIQGIWKDKDGVWWVNEGHMKPDFAKAENGVIPMKLENSTRLATQADIEFAEWLNDGKEPT